MTESDPILELDALLDPARLAAAWQVARDRPASVAEVADVPDVADDADAVPVSRDRAAEVTATEVMAAEVTAADAVAADAAVEAGEPALPTALPVALAHRQLLDEIERTLAAAPGLADRARRVLAVPLAQLAQKLDPIDLAAAESVLDQLEDVSQALLSEAGWPELPERDED